MYDCRYWLWLSEKFEPGSIRCDKLLAAFDYNPQAIYEADRGAYEKICGSNLRAVNALCDKTLDSVYKNLQFCEKNNIGILTMDDERYPSGFKCIDGQPPVIYYKGTIPDFETRFTLSIVGTRNVSPPASNAAYTIAHDIASCGGIIVSGMALGSDTAAHRGALDAKGTTVAFLGCGIDVVYPKDNAYMMEEIISTGVVMTDYPPHSRPEGRHFPVRNRLISAVSNGVLVVEAGRKSGALITAEHAVKQGKLLYALPGQIGEFGSEGSNRLLVKGAKTVMYSSDIIADYRHLFNLTDKVDMSGFKQIRLGMHPELDTPYKSPQYNPFAVNKASYVNKNNRESFYDKFLQYRPKKEEPKKEPQSRISAPKYADLNVQSKGFGFEVASPRPRIVFSDFNDEEHAKAYMSMSAEEKAEIDRLDSLMGRPVISYSRGPMPEGGYKVNITPEKRARYNCMTASIADGDLKIENIDKIRCNSSDTEEFTRDLKSLLRKYIPHNNDAPQAKEDTLTGIELSILRLLENGNKLTIEQMSHLGVPLSKLLSVLSMLELKKHIIRHPNGYFELNRNK